MATTLENDTTATTEYLASTEHTDEAFPRDTFESAPAPAATPTQGLSISSLVLGVASFVFGFSFVVPAAGLILGIMALKREPQGKTLAVVGIVTSALNLGWVVLAALGLALIIPFAGLALPWMI